jgi:glucan phosphoethanolaminetransferase (alkaline phosphatase superfamily)
VRIVKGILVGLAIFTVSTMSYGLIRGTIEFYRIAQAVKTGAIPKVGAGAWYTGGFIHNPYLWLVLFVSVAIGIWIVKRRGISSSAMKRLLFSTFIGFAFVAVVMTAGARVLSRTGYHYPPSPKDLTIMKAISFLLYWPDRFLVVKGLDCPNADLIAEKMACVGLCLGLSCLAYSAVTFVLLSLVQKWWRPLGRKRLSSPG